MPIITARDVLRLHWDNSLPVDLIGIANRLGVVTFASSDLTSSGHYTPAKEGQRALIEYNAHEHPVRQRFTIAHELGHHVLHNGERDRELPCDFTMGGSQEEREANQFAAELLMPEDAVNVLVRIKNVVAVPELAKIFGVSYSAMRWRLHNLGYNV
ncbi:MAG: ImmA/IrrE family metallo-endopeptidase [Desulfovibrionales bacterium]|nr:ImmA/IrrE family metallo-endopeptidase [Desulfovibrionales bacterium]